MLSGLLNNPSPHSHLMQLNPNKRQANARHEDDHVQDPEDKGPRSKPLASMEELLHWHPGEDDYNVSNTPLHPRPYARSHKPEMKMIVCHDMAGGYTEDAATQGNDFSTIFNIQSWRYIDTFIYFSHARVTIPPPCWINAAHRNGVKCLGTYITEWLPGIVETDQLVSGPGAVLSTEPIGEDDRGKEKDPDKPKNYKTTNAQPDKVDRRWFSKLFADKLVDIAVYYRFDGWLINIESILRGGHAQAKQMVAFLSYLRQQIHARIPGGELIWYDSVIYTTGELAWQDMLNALNYPFFEQSDGIFTNYTWEEPQVKESVRLAGHRRGDVYTGIDVWGRGTFGGGGFYSYKALEVIKREGASAALFAPGYIYQELGAEDFLVHDRLFWTGFAGAGIHAESVNKVPKLPPPPPKPPKDPQQPDVPQEPQEPKVPDEEAYLPVAAVVTARPSGSRSWFYTNFDRGFGSKLFIQGKKVRGRPWSNLSRQSLPPNMANEVFVLQQDLNSGLKLEPCSYVRWILSPDDAYYGGTSVLIEEVKCPEQSASALASGHTTVGIPLYDTQIALKSSSAWSVEVIYKRLQRGVHLILYMGVSRSFGAGKAPMVVQEHQQWKPDSGTVPLLIAQDVQTGASAAKATSVIALDVEGTEGGVHTTQTLENGWHKVVVNLTGLLEQAGYTQEFLGHGSVLAHLGVTLTFPAKVFPPDTETRPLALLGSLAVLPLYSSSSSSSSGLFALRASDTSVKILRRRTSLSPLSDSPESTAMASDQAGNTYLEAWSTLDWDIGYPAVPQDQVSSDGDDDDDDSDDEVEEVSPFEYSHFNVYLSYEPPSDSMAPLTGESLVYVGAAFTTKYRIHGSAVAIPPRPPQLSASLNFGNDAKAGSLFRLVAWVQGVRRNGQLDPREEWVSRELS